jgi:DNA-binding response OmpR family regulator
MTMFPAAAQDEATQRILASCGAGHDLTPVHYHRILAVDDDEALLELMSSALVDHDYEVDVARRCKDAMSMIMFRDYCGVLLDLILPDANGLSLFRQIARRRPALRPRVIFVTGAMDRREADRFVSLIHNKVLLKPFRLEDLVAAVRQMEAPVVR